MIAPCTGLVAHVGAFGAELVSGYTGDAWSLNFLPVAERIGTLRQSESFLGDDGLLRDVTGWVLIDWASF